MKTFGASLLILGLVLVGGGRFPAAGESTRHADPPIPVSPGTGHKDLVPALIVALKDKDEDETVRGNAAQALVGLGHEAVPSLIVLLKSDNNDLRIKAATVLANMKPGQAKEAIPVLLKTLQNRKEDKDFRRQATLALSQIVGINR
jgi:HEAT repeat protein